jgi:hypothetical protein
MLFIHINLISIILLNTILSIQCDYIANLLFNYSSTCYNSIDSHFNTTKLRKLISDINNAKKIQIQNYNSAVYLNFGAGTTGTHTLYYIMVVL